MAKKTFYIDLEKQKFNETMIVNKQISFNHMIRKRKTKNQIKFLDNHSSVSCAPIEKEVKNWEPFHLNELQLQHPRHKIFRFKLNIPYETYRNSNQSYFDSFCNLFRNMKFKPDKVYPVMILCPMKGGYLGYIFGIVGFIPENEYQLSRKSYLSTSTLFTKKKVALFSPKEIKSSKLSSMKKKVIFKEIPLRLPFLIYSKDQWINRSDSNFSKKNPPERTDGSRINFFFEFYKEEFKLQDVKKIEKLENNKKETLLETETYEQKNKNKKQIKQKYFGKFKSKPTTQKESPHSNHLFESNNNQGSTTTQNNKALLLHHKE